MVPAKIGNGVAKMDKAVLSEMVEEGLSSYAIARRIGKAQTTVRYWLNKHGLKTQRHQRKWTDDEFIKAVKSSYTIAEVMRKLNLAKSGGGYPLIKKHVARLGLDTSHFTGKASGRGGCKTKSLDEILVENSSFSRCWLKTRLLREGLLASVCSICGQGNVWQGNPLTLILDHINGINNDHRLQNLRMVCPNCNAQLPTSRGQGKGAVWK